MDRVIGTVGQRPAVKAELAVADQADAVRGRLEQELKLLRPLLRDRAQRSARQHVRRPLRQKQAHQIRQRHTDRAEHPPDAAAADRQRKDIADKPRAEHRQQQRGRIAKRSVPQRRNEHDEHKQARAARSGCHRRKKSAPAAHSAIENRIDCLDRDQQRQIHRNDHSKQPHRQLRQEQQARAQQQLDSRQHHGHPAGTVAAPARKQQVHKAAQRQEQTRQQQHDMRRSGASGHQRGAEAEHADAGQHGKQQQIQQSHHGGPSSRQALRASACQKRPFGLLRQAAFRIAKSVFDSLTRCARYSDWIDFAYSEGDMPNLSLNWREKWWIVE